MTADDPNPVVADTLLTGHGSIIDKISTNALPPYESEDYRSWISSVALGPVTILSATTVALRLTQISMTKRQIPSGMSIPILPDPDTF